MLNHKQLSAHKSVDDISIHTSGDLIIPLVLRAHFCHPESGPGGTRQGVEEQWMIPNGWGGRRLRRGLDQGRGKMPCNYNFHFSLLRLSYIWQPNSQMESL